MVKIKIIREDGEDFVIDNTVWGIPSDGLIGFDSVDVENTTFKMAYGDGGRFTGSRVAEKDRTIKARLKNPKFNASRRHEAISFFLPKKNYEIHLTYQGVERWCKGVYSKFTCPAGNIYKPVEFAFTILCPMPYMLSEDNFGQDIASSIPLASFPYTSNLKTGFATGVYRFAEEVTLQNDGAIPTQMKIVITAADEVVSPKIICNRDNFVLIKDNMQKGDRYELDFTANPPTFKKNGVNAINKIDRSSSLSEMDLKVGKNVISYDAFNGKKFMTVELYFNQKFIGV